MSIFVVATYYHAIVHSLFMVIHIGATQRLFAKRFQAGSANDQSVYDSKHSGKPQRDKQSERILCGELSDSSHEVYFA